MLGEFQRPLIIGKAKRPPPSKNWESTTSLSIGLGTKRPA